MQHSIIIWEKSAWCQIPGKGWTRLHLSRLEDIAAVVQEHCAKGDSLTFLYDPEILQTEFTECPFGGRTVIREALSSTHESIANPHTAWCYQVPWPLSATSGGNQGTFCSYETTPSLHLINQTLGDLGYSVAGAFPMASVTTHGGFAAGRTSVLLVVDPQQGQAFVYIFAANGVRACRKLYGAGRADYDIWSAISMVLGEYGVTLEDGGQRPYIRIYQAPGCDCKTQCPYWDIFKAQAQVELLDFGSLATLIRRIPSGHSSSLLADLPRAIRLDRGMRIASIVTGILVLGLAGYAIFDLGKERTAISAKRKQENLAQQQRNHLQDNRLEIDNLRRLYSQDIFEYSRGRVALMESLATAIPREATLISVRAGGEPPAVFDIRGVFWNRNVEAASARGKKGAPAGDSAPLAGIKSTLENTVRGLLVNPESTQFTGGSGDFVLTGTTPLPELGAAPKTEAGAPAPAATNRKRTVSLPTRQR
ncbi:hypothetical protein OPIT5_04650 [Opitutaceae bacterium TAV5]|nr:hypothetical protein OPIT5_04650 [Opitutaceae bacterium TAV5]